MSAPRLGPAGSAWPCLKHDGQVGQLLVSVHPSARRTGADGLRNGALRIHLSAAPADNAANQELIHWLAKELGCPKRAVRIKRGQAARLKSIEIDLPVAPIECWLARAVPITAATSPMPWPPVR